MVNSFCLLDQSKFGPGDAMLAGMSQLRPRDSIEGFPSPNRRHSSILQAICSPRLMSLSPFGSTFQGDGADSLHGSAASRDKIHIV